MKTNILRSIILLISLQISSIVYAYDFVVDGIYYNIVSPSNLEVEVTYKDQSRSNSIYYVGHIKVPETVVFNDRVYSVTRIGSKAFYYCDNLTSINMPCSITSIEDEAFWHCSNLTSVLIPKLVTNIGSYAFAGCSKLMEVFFLSAIKPIIGSYVYSNCHSALEQYVPSKEVFGFGTEYIAFGAKSYPYTGMSPKVEWSNNLRAYNATLNIEEVELEKKAGTHTTNLIAKYSNGVDFEVEIPYSYEITKAPLTITVNNSEREYGDDNPEFTCEVSGFVDGESLNTLSLLPTYTCEATKNSNVGSYRIFAELDAPNYDITCNYGTLLVIKAPITATVKNATKIYGTGHPAFELLYMGLKNNEIAPIWESTPKLTTTATKESSCGVYPITANGGVSTNYEITQYIPGELTITKRELTVKANDCSKTYGTDNPNFSLSYTGFVNYDNKKSLEKEPIVMCDATKMSNVGTYPIYLNGGESLNYTFQYESGVLTIKQATQEILWDFTITEAKVGDQIELNAKATSGLKVSYNVSDESIAKVYISNGKVYLDCLKEGTVKIEVSQHGDDNYVAADKVKKTLIIKDMSNITDIYGDNSINVVATENGIRVSGAKNKTKVEIYSVNGQCVYSGYETLIPVDRKGLYIVKVNSKAFKVIY